MFCVHALFGVCNMETRDVPYFGENNCVDVTGHQYGDYNCRHVWDQDS